MKKKIVFDPALRQPGCVLLQAAAGCDPAVARRFPAETCLFNPTPGMGIDEATDEEIDALIVMAERAIAMRKKPCPPPR